MCSKCVQNRNYPSCLRFVLFCCILPTLAVSGVIEHIDLDEGLDMVDKAGVGGKKMNKSEMT